MRAAIIVCLVLCVSLAQAGFWNIGCFKDTLSNRRLPDKLFQGNDLTIIKCIDLCKFAPDGYDYAGLENGNQCFCGNKFPTGKPRPDDECDTPCTGNANKICGGKFRITVYAAKMAYRGCFQDGNNPPLLPAKKFTKNNLTRIRCINLCEGFQYAGVENGNKCYCGNIGPAFPALKDDECDKNCSGAAFEKCGGFFKINVFRRS